MNDNWVYTDSPATATEYIPGVTGVRLTPQLAEQMARIINVAARLEAFLGKCTGSSDEFPISIVANDDVYANMLTGLLTELSCRLFEAGVKLQFDASDMPPPPQETNSAI